MRAISNRALIDFVKKYPDAAIPLQLWRKLVEAKDYANFAELKSVFGTVDKAGGYHIFDIGGNKYRLIAAIHYNRQRLFVRHIFTHPQYEHWKPQ